jgi:hypothetical protein
MKARKSPRKPAKALPAPGTRSKAIAHPNALKRLPRGSGVVPSGTPSLAGNFESEASDLLLCLADELIRTYRRAADDSASAAHSMYFALRNDLRKRKAQANGNGGDA